MKILISWLAYAHDFKEGNAITGGPTYSFHKDYYKKEKYGKHILLSGEKEDDLRLIHLCQLLRKDFKDHEVEEKYMNIQDVISLTEIRPKVASLLEEHKEHEIDIFFSPGTSIMQLAWYICHSSMLHIKTRLIQTRPQEHKKGKPDFDIIQVEKSDIPNSLLTKQISGGKTEYFEETDYLFTDSIKPVYENARKVAEAPGVHVLILGASGTGKEHLANFIHKYSARSGRPFVPVNCSSLTDELLNSHLFGHKRGAYTGAVEDRKGIFEEADGGTVFLDEIGDISPFMQQSLLRVLQEGEILPLGETKAKKVNVRIIAATHRNLVELCEKEKFRWDLYYRLSTAELELPSLEERGTKEKEELINFFIKKLKKDLKRNCILSLTKEIKEVLYNYSFPGNIREMVNILSSLYVFCEQGEVKTLSQLPKRILQAKEKDSLHWKDVEKKHIIRVLKIHQGNLTRTGKAIGYGSINTTKKKIKEYGLENLIGELK